MATVEWTETTSRRIRRTSAPVSPSTCFHRTALSSSWMQIAFGIVVRLALAVVQHGVDVGDLAQAVAAELQRRRHEAEAPLADVVGGAAVVVERRSRGTGTTISANDIR